MNYKTYLLHCLETWGGDNRRQRCELAIIEEVGEFIGKYQKFLRGDYKINNTKYDDIIKFKEDICKEFGDVIFYITLMINEFKQEYDLEDFDVDFNDVVARNFDIDLFRGDNTTVIKNCAYRIFDYLSALERVQDKEGIFRSMYSVIFHLAFKRFMILPEEILEKNILKLQDRKKRGVILGSGDNR